VTDETAPAFGLILCGAGESGKTTFTRQLKLSFLPLGISDEDRTSFIPTIRGNLIETMQCLLQWVEQNSGELPEELLDCAALVTSTNAFSAAFTNELADALAQLWSDPVVADAFEHKDETIIADHMDYFFGKLDALADEEYVPTDDDILRARIRTVGVKSVTFNAGRGLVRIYDVGGQKNERGKWERINAEVRGVIFCVSFADFDKPMFEELPNRVARIFDAIDIFADMVHKPKFAAAPIFFIANKFDMFTEKVTRSDCFVRVFPEYQGDPHNVDATAEFLTQKFLARAEPRTEAQPIVVYRQSALEPENVVENARDICRVVGELVAAGYA
jgi:guanine nucleotide-binding protein G(o) subunit alpha